MSLIIFIRIVSFCGFCYSLFYCIINVLKIAMDRLTIDNPLSDIDKVMLFPYYEKIARYGFLLVFFTALYPLLWE